MSRDINVDIKTSKTHKKCVIFIPVPRMIHHQHHPNSINFASNPFLSTKNTVGLVKPRDIYVSHRHLCSATFMSLIFILIIFFEKNVIFCTEIRCIYSSNFRISFCISSCSTCFSPSKICHSKIFFLKSLI